MFVAVACDFASEDHANEVHNILNLYGFTKIQSNLYESQKITENTVSRLKRDIDRATDSYDSIRFYQFPLEDTLAITSLKAKKWRRSLLLK